MCDAFPRHSSPIYLHKKRSSSSLALEMDMGFAELLAVGRLNLFGGVDTSWVLLCCDGISYNTEPGASPYKTITIPVCASTKVTHLEECSSRSDLQTWPPMLP